MRHRKYPVVENFFDSWSKEMAYALGFISADGYVNDYSLTVDLQVRDKEVLHFLGQKLCPTAELKSGHDGKSLRLRVNSQILIRSLKNYNVVRAKSLILRANFDIPEQYRSHYLRGVFDGDGWVITRRNMIECGIVSGSRQFLEDLRTMAGGIGKIRQRTKKNSNSICYFWEMQTKKDTLKFRDLIYKEDCFSLVRKREIFFSDFYKPSARFWTKSQLDYLRENYKPKTDGCLQKIANVIGKSPKAVSKMVWQLNLANQQRQ